MRKMKSIHVILSAVLVALSTVWARAAIHGLDQALVSIAVEAVLKRSKREDKPFPSIISSFWSPSQWLLNPKSHRHDGDSDGMQK